MFAKDICGRKNVEEAEEIAQEPRQPTPLPFEIRQQYAPAFIPAQDNSYGGQTIPTKERLARKVCREIVLTKVHQVCRADGSIGKKDGGKVEIPNIPQKQ